MKRVAIVGYGKIARKHIAALRKVGCKIVASCNRSENGNLAASREEKIPFTFYSLDEMIRKTKPDGVLVSVSFDHIYQVAKELIPYQIPLLLEKPTGTCLEEHLELAGLAKQYKTPVQVALNRRHYSVVEKAVADAGGRDAISSVVVEWSERPEYLFNERNFTPEQIRQVIIGNSIHGIDLMLYIAGGCDDWQMLALEKDKPFRWLMNVCGISERQILFNFHSSWDSPVPWRLVLHSKHKRYVFAPLETCSVFEENIKGTRSIEPEWFDKEMKAGFYTQSSRFLDLMKGIPNSHNLDSATCSVRMADKLTQAFQSIDVPVN